MERKYNRNIIICHILCGLVLLFISSSVLADEEKPTAGADITILSKYMWRGMELSDDSLVIQPSITVAFKGISFNLWGNLDLDQDGDSEEKSQFNETDMTFSYEKSIGMIGLGVGYIYYGLDGTDDSEEIYVSIGLDTLLSPNITIYREIAHLPACYINFGISHSFNLPEEISLDLAGSVGYYFSDDDDFTEYSENGIPAPDKYRNFHDGLVSVELTIPLCDYAIISPMLAYSFPLIDDADNFITACSFSDESDFIFGGATVSISF